MLSTREQQDLLTRINQKRPHGQDAKQALQSAKSLVQVTVDGTVVHDYNEFLDRTKAGTAAITIQLTRRGKDVLGRAK